MNGPGVLAFDGERERVLKPDQRARLTVQRDGPWVIDVAKTLAQAAACRRVQNSSWRHWMATEIYLVKVGMTMTEGIVEEWYVPDGGTVEQGRTAVSARNREGQPRRRRRRERHREARGRGGRDDAARRRHRLHLRTRRSDPLNGARRRRRRRRVATAARSDAGLAAPRRPTRRAARALVARRTAARR